MTLLPTGGGKPSNTLISVTSRRPALAQPGLLDPTARAPVRSHNQPCTCLRAMPPVARGRGEMPSKIRSRESDGNGRLAAGLRGIGPWAGSVGQPERRRERISVQIGALASGVRSRPTRSRSVISTGLFNGGTDRGVGVSEMDNGRLFRISANANVSASRGGRSS